MPFVDTTWLTQGSIATLRAMALDIIPTSMQKISERRKLFVCSLLVICGAWPQCARVDHANQAPTCPK